ncbi:MAG: TonB-dependent receptor plug domain-containing protein [candidate division Zixibacteria bacterium]|nr:TonB-dependent receptor plug domain-containing protein [candidate division Zixibacteria bacterium]
MYFSRRLPLASLITALCLIHPPIPTNAETPAIHALNGAGSNAEADTLNKDVGISALRAIVDGHDQNPLEGIGRVIFREEIRNLAARGAQDFVALQPGVVFDRQSGKLYVRGSPANGLVYYVDGVPLQDAFSGTSAPLVGAASIDQIRFTAGGIGADQGWGMSGVTEISTVEGGRRMHGSAEAITDNFHGDNFDYNLHSVAVNGPLVPNSDRLTFSIAAEREWKGDRQPHAKAGGILPHNGSSVWKWNGKLRWKATDKITARFGALGFHQDFKEYLRPYHFDIVHAPRTVEKGGTIWGEISRTPSARTNYSLRAYHVSQDRRRGDGVYFDDVLGYGRPIRNPQLDIADLFWSWDDMNLDSDSLANGVYFPKHTEVVESTYTIHLPGGDSIQRSLVLRGDEGSVWEDYLREQGSYFGGRADLTTHFRDAYTASVGADFQRHTLRYYHHPFPQFAYQGVGDGFRDADFYGFDELGATQSDGGLNGAKHPVRIAGYAQGNLALAGVAITAGLQLDYFDYRSYALRNPANPPPPGSLSMSDLERTKTVMRLSPRIGAAFEVPGGTQLHISAGRHNQWPDMQYVYMNYDLLGRLVGETPYPFVLSNPRLKPLETVHEEVGFRHRFAELSTASIKCFFNKISNNPMVDWQADRWGGYRIYSDKRTVTSKGIEFQLDTKRRWGLSGQLTYTIQAVKTSYWTWIGQETWYGLRRVHVSGPAEYDQRRKLTVIADARLGAKKGLKLGQTHPFERCGIGLVFSAANGFPYAPAVVYNAVAPTGPSPNYKPYNNERVPALYRLDLKVNKEFSSGAINFDLFLWVLNVFNRANALEVYSGTGKPDDTGWLSTMEGQSWASGSSTPSDASGMTGEQKYRLREQDPLNYDTPRQIRVGLIVAF